MVQAGFMVERMGRKIMLRHFELTPPVELLQLVLVLLIGSACDSSDRERSIAMFQIGKDALVDF